ncbi:MAG TPA: hypothetical protein VGQ83_40220 [Polyangia bacterium]|jgi:hypothetical protein
MTEQRHVVIGRSAPGDRDPEDARERPDPDLEDEERDRGLDKTLADSFPASDPPSTIPDSDEEDDPFAGD